MKNYHYKKIDENGNTLYYNEQNELHRLDGPALEYANGSKVWLQNGKWHRLAGPTFEWAIGTKWWYINNNLVGASENGFTEEDFENYKQEHNIKNKEIRMKNYILAKDTPRIIKGARIEISNYDIIARENNYMQKLNLPERDLKVELERLLHEGWIEEAKEFNIPDEIYVNTYEDGRQCVRASREDAFKALCRGGVVVKYKKEETIWSNNQ